MKEVAVLRIAVVSFSLGMALTAGVLCLCLSVESVEKTRAAYATQKSLDGFHAQHYQNSNHIRSWTLIGAAAQTEELQNRSIDLVVRFTERQVDVHRDFKRSYRRQKRKSKGIKSLKDKVKKLDIAFDAYMKFHEAIPENSQRIVDSTETFDDYWHEYSNIYRTTARSNRLAFDRAHAGISRELQRISQRSSRTIFYAGLAQSILTVLAFAALSHVIFSTRKEHRLKLKSQETLSRQQAHEMRNKYGPAIFVLEQLLQHLDDHSYQEEHDDCSLKKLHLQQLAPECHGALGLLKEVELQHQARLDMYRILRGNYQASMETFDLVSMLLERVDAERLIDRAQNRNLADRQVEYRVQVPQDLYLKENEIQIRTDLYILKHLIQNLTSNARKFTFKGSITVSFLGPHPTNPHLLVFSVKDTGTGLPPRVLSTIFHEPQNQVTGDNRGSGIGLNSCAVFCKAANGYIKVKETVRQNTTKALPGSTEFEFAVRGHLIRPGQTTTLKLHQPLKVVYVSDDTSSSRSTAHETKKETTNESKTLPPLLSQDNSEEEEHKGDNPQLLLLPLIVIDDSNVNRICIIRSLQKVAPLFNITWSPIDQFETYEASQSRIKQLHQNKTFAVITCDNNLQSRGGEINGTQAIKWLLKELCFSGLIISASGDPLAAQAHLKLGAHIAWCKPLPSKQVVAHDLQNALKALGLTLSGEGDPAE